MAIYNSIFTGAEIDAILSSSPTLQVITSSGTYTPGATVKAIKVTLVGGGGGAGGVDGLAGGKALSGGAGGGGSSIKTITSLESSYSVVIGAGGAGGAAGANNGSAGGTSTFIGDDTATTAMSASGGNGSFLGRGTISSSSAGTADGGTASGGDVNIKGGAGIRSAVVNGEIACVGAAGSSLFGGGNPGSTVITAGAPFNYGEGGAGSGSNTATDYAGVAGADGVCIIEEFF